MIKTDEEALICDLAETYHIYDYRQLPLKTIAVFSVGLKNTSRIKMKMSNQIVQIDTLILAGISDKISYWLWSQSKDGQKGVNKTHSLVDVLMNVKTTEKNVISFESGKDFKKMRNELLTTVEKGG